MDSLAPEVVEPLLGGRFGHPYRFVPSCPSTQDLLRPDDDPEGAAVAADEQTAGRGRRGRRWEAPPEKAILCSVLLRPPPGRRLPELSLVAGLAVVDAVEAALGLGAEIKWPNDVLVSREKVSGVLAEAREGVVVVGIGLNVNQRRDELPPTPITPAASLLIVDGVERARAPILAHVLARLERRYEQWRAGGIDALSDDLGRRDFLRGRRVTVDGLAGTALAIDRLGRLEVDVDGERRAIESGEVAYERPGADPPAA
jgi:BirA family transcriptional regulator, biotin operon repressor / biotin---[acetyl-CoA-carboxylase] ligase